MSALSSLHAGRTGQRVDPNVVAHLLELGAELGVLLNVLPVLACKLLQVGPKRVQLRLHLRALAENHPGSVGQARPACAAATGPTNLGELQGVQLCSSGPERLLRSATPHQEGHERILRQGARPKATRAARGLRRHGEGRGLRRHGEERGLRRQEDRYRAR